MDVPFQTRTQRPLAGLIGTRYPEANEPSALIPRAHPSELADARRYLGDADPADFVRRQRDARLRVALMNGFYVRFPSRMGALHELAAAGIAVARFAARSEVYDAIGERLLPVDADGRPRTPAWSAYVASFHEGLPADVREERWLAAHFADMQAVKAEGWIERFADERAEHRDDPAWDMLAEHIGVTLGTRVQDGAALAGRVALETAIASSLRQVVVRQWRTGAGLVRQHVASAIWATLSGGPWVPPHLPSDRRLVLRLVVATVGALRIARVWRLGVRRQARGAEGPGAAWSLTPSLEAVLGPGLPGIDGQVAAMFSAMHSFQMTASVHLYHRAGVVAAWLATLLVGQGMYEAHLDEVEARFRLFRRDDGSLHFVREFWCEEAVRVFDSDFVVRDVDGRPTLLEVFAELGVACQMRTEVLPDGGLAMTVVRLFVGGVSLPVGPVQVCFETRPDGARLRVTGVLDVKPRSAWEQLLFARLFALPERVGEIRYFATPNGGNTEPSGRTTST